MATPATTPNNRRMSLIHEMTLDFDDDGLDKKVLDDFLANPALVGFLEHFAAKCFCDENLRFFHSVGWWINKYESQSEADIILDAKAIYEEFLATNSPTEISLSSGAREGVMEALECSPPTQAAFELAIKEAHQTLKSDLFLRFKQSEDYVLLRRLMSVKRSADDIFSKFSSMGILPDTLFNQPGFKLKQIDFPNVTLDQILSDKYMTRVFTKYLGKLHAAENTMCYQAIQGFKKHFDEKSNKSKEIAWLIYVAFIMEGSEYEVSTTIENRKEIAFQLGKPSIKMFGDIEKSCNEMQKAKFAAFAATEEYQSLKNIMVNAKKNQGKDTPTNTPRSAACVLQ